MLTKKVKIGVIGAGIIGTSSALALIESIPDIEITLISEKFSPNTTSDGSGGLIYPYLPGKTNPKKVSKWFGQTIKFLNKHLMSSNGGKLGIGLLSVYMLSTEKQYEKPETAQHVVSYREITDKELQLFGEKYKSGAFVTTYYAESAKLLPFFLKLFKTKGGKVVQKRITNLEEMLGHFDIVINCTGVEAPKLVDDPKSTPIRGQVFRVFAPWIKHCVMAENYYIIPNTETVVLGGTMGYGDWNQDIDPKDSQNIMNGCSQLFPSLKSATIVNEWVGLRPGREEVRLETEVIKKSGNKLHVVHNYGHGGSGVTLFWGCAQDVLLEVNQILGKTQNSKL